MDSDNPPPSDPKDPSVGVAVLDGLIKIEKIDGLIKIEERAWKKSPRRGGDMNSVSKVFIDAMPEDLSLPVHARREDRNAEWSQKDKILRSLAASLPNCSGDKCHEALRLMCATIEDVFKSGHDGATDKAITMVAKYLLPGAMNVLRKEGYYEDLKIFIGPEEVKADLAGSAKATESKLYMDMQFLVNDMYDFHYSTINGLTPLELFQQLAGSILSPSDAPLRDLTQSAAEAYVLVGKGQGWQAAQQAMFGQQQPANARA